MKLDPIGNLPVIETEFFDLRPLRRSDMGLIDHYAGDARVARMTTSIPHPLPPGATEAYVDRCLREDRTGSNTSPAASKPMSWCGRRTVVSGGRKNCAISRSS